MVSAWEEVEPGVTVKCFKHVAMYPEEKDNSYEDDDPFAGEDLLDLDEKVREVSGDATIDTLTYVTVVDYDSSRYMATLNTYWSKLEKRPTRRDHWEAYLHVRDHWDQSDGEEISEEVDQYMMPPQVSTFRGAIKVANN